MNGRTEITLVKSVALRGENPLCRNKWKTRPPRLKGTLRDLLFRRFTGAQPTVTDTAHYTGRLYGVECELLSTYDLQGK